SPIRPPLVGVLEEAVRAPGEPRGGVAMPPLADQPPPRGRESAQEPRDRVRVGVEPPAHREDGAPDRVVVLAHRSLLPEVVAPLVAEPGVNPEPAAAETLEPHVAPARADYGGIRRARVVGEHGRRPAQVV